MKTKLNILQFFIAGLICLALSLYVFGSPNTNDSSESSYEFLNEIDRSTDVSEIIETAKAPTYYTVFNVILNYLPLKK